MKAAIIENEVLSQEKLISLLHSIDSSIEVIAKLESVKESIEWLKNNTPDILFVDVELNDGISFQIFDHIQVKCPIIFITAYDQYAIRAFQISSLDYLLKPIQKDSLASSLIKFYKNKSQDALLMDYQLQETRQVYRHKYKSRFMTKIGDVYNFIPVKDIAFFYLDRGGTALVTWTNKKYYIDYNLDELESTLDPDYFYRINRSFINHIDSIEQVIRFSNRRLKIVIKNNEDKEVIMSREKVTDFKSWLDN